jgi:DNA-binding beta-propeller fold protein YncE
MRHCFLTLTLLALASCSPTGAESELDLTSADTRSPDRAAPGPSHYLAALTHTLLMGSEDNAEVVKMVPGATRALLVSSKARKVTLLETATGSLTVVREVTLFPADVSESELTHIAASPDGAWAVVTRTFIEVDQNGGQVDCGGELVFLDTADNDAFGSVLLQLPVGPMPDSVAISDDGNCVASANERDGPNAWGKCEVAGEVASISIVDVSGGPTAAKEVHRLTMVDGTTGPREPESVVFGADNDLVVATLQDSHEVLLVRRSALVEPEMTVDDAAVTIIRLPDDEVGAGPWPDGISRVAIGGKEHFVIAGEWNDTFTVIDGTGAVVASVSLQPGDIPGSLPRVLDEGSPRFSPDSIATFVWQGRPHAAFTLRHSGAVAVYDLTDATHPTFAVAVGVGLNEAGGQDEEGSTVRPEGIAASPDGGIVVVANEGESSVSLVTRID